MIRKVKIKDIQPNPFQARKGHDAESIKALSHEIEKLGLWNGAIRGREHNGHVELCFGHRRLEAVKRLGWKEVDVDVVKLSDEEMALQALVENLQRQGLNDADKADGIVAYIKLRQESSNLAYAKLLDETGRLLGYTKYDLELLLKIAGLTEPAKDEIRAGKLTGRAADEARRLAGKQAKPEEVEQIIRNAAEKEVGAWALQSMGKKLNEVKDEIIREKVRKEVVKGKVTTPEQVVTKARQMEAAKQPREKIPPDLIDVMRGWTERAQRWAGELEQVAPYIDYIDREPAVAKRWRAAVQTLIEKLQKFV